MHHQWSCEELLKVPVFRGFPPVHLPTVQARLMFNPYPKFHTSGFFLIGTHFYFAGTWVAFSKLLRITTIKKSRWSGRILKDGTKGI